MPTVGVRQGGNFSASRKIGPQYGGLKNKILGYNILETRIIIRGPKIALVII